MKYFKLFEDWNNEISEDSINEASIADHKKYPINGTHPFALNDKGKALFKKEFKMLPKGVLTKTSQEPTNKKLIYDNSKARSSVNINVTDGTDTWSLTDSKGKLKGYFVHGKDDPSAIKWGEQTFETAACLGLYFDPYKYLEAFGKFNKKSDLKILLKPYNSALADVKKAINANKSEALGGQALLDKLDTSNPTTQNVSDMIRLLQLTNGAHIFAKTFGCEGWNYIHRSIGSYYDSEKLNPFIEHEAGKHKDNTADTIFFSGKDVKKFLKEIETEKITTDNTGKCTTESGTSFYQISNKESEKGAQLGRFKEIVDDKFELKGAKQRFDAYLKESLLYNLDEGLGDWVKKAASKVKDKFTSFAAKIKEKISKFSSKIIDSFKSIGKESTTPPKDVQKLISNSLNEADSLSYTEYAEKCAKEFIDGDTSRLKKLYDLVDTEWKGVQSMVSSMEGGILTPDSKGPTFPTDIKDETVLKELTLKYMTNVTAYQDMQSIFKKNEDSIKQASEVLEDFVDFEKEIYFGSTTLPLYKLYNSDKASGKPWSYLNDGSDYKEKRKSVIEEFKSKSLPGLVVDSSLQEKKGGYCTVVAFVFSDFVDTEGFNYTKVDFRSGSSSSYSYSISASTTVSYAYLKKNKDI